MAPTLHSLALDRPFPDALARLVLALCPRAGAGDLAGGLVLLPSVRACASLRHALLERSGRDALLLPEIATPRQLTAPLAGRFGLAPAPAVPDGLRALALAGRLSRLRWAERQAGGAAGLAGELVRTFDELRRAGRGGLLAGEETAALAGLDPSRRALAAGDLARLSEAWALYREAFPRDETDLLLDVVHALGRSGWPGPADGPVVAAGFAELDAATARVVRAALDRGGAADGHVVDAAAGGAVARAFLGTYADPDAASHPLTPARRAREALTPGAAPGPAGGASGGTAPELLSCADPEDESRAVADVVCEALARGGRGLRIAVATHDSALARRVAAQLRDAGVDFDDTAGRPLSTQPAGRFAHALVQCALTGLRHGPVLEALTHPYADLLGSRSAHARRALLLEGLALRGEAPPLGAEDYWRRAVEQDAAYRRAHPGAPAGLAEFVAALLTALAPLLDLPPRPLPWTRRLEALRRAWSAFAPAHPLAPGGGRDERREDLVALGRLFDDLAGLAAAGALGDTTAEDFAAALDRLLAATTVRPRRAALRPVQVMGLVEARLERFDLLVVCGLNEEVFPGRVPRPLLLGEPARRALGLPVWRAALGVRGETFLRLLHGGDRVVLAWSRERDGQPALPSPLVERLLLGLRLPAPDPAPRRALRRRVPPDLAAIGAAQAAFAAEPADVPAHVPTPPRRRLSHTALAMHGGCPYRFLLERGFGLAEPEEVVETFRHLEHGRAVHECLRRLLEPGGEGPARLSRGDDDGALALLRAFAAEEFGRAAAGLPQRRLWEEAFLAAAPAIVTAEIARLPAWEPRALEREFQLTLGGLHAWLTAECAATGEDLPAPPAGETAAVLLRGKIDRVDLARDGRPRAAVIDYKTGRLPTKAAVAGGDEPQLVLYAVAVESGAVEGLADGWPVGEIGYYRVAADTRGLELQLTLDGPPAGRAPLRAGARSLLAAALAAAAPAGPFPLVPAHRAGEAQGDPPCRLCALRGICRIDERELPWTLRARLAAGGRRWR